MKPLTYKPDYAVPPGDTIKETLETNKQTITDLANSIGESVDDMVDVVEARRPITEDLAEKLEQFFKIAKTFWLNAQDNYDSTMYRLFWERVRKPPNLFAHFDDDQIEALQALFQCVNYESMPSTEEVNLYRNVDIIEQQFNEEFNGRFFPKI